MTVTNRCPECGKVFSKKIIRCNCGHILIVEPVVSTHQDQCQFREYGIQCIKTGTHSKGTRGSSKWLCFQHWYLTRNH